MECLEGKVQNVEKMGNVYAEVLQEIREEQGL